MRDLTSRLREIVRRHPLSSTHAGSPSETASNGAGTRELTYVPDPDLARPLHHAAVRLGGRMLDEDGACVVVDRLYAADRSHGRRRLEACVPAAHLPIHLFDAAIARRDEWARRVVFLDIETTGLSGGAGTLAFLVGCGWFENDGFLVRQFFLAGPSGERAMLDALADVLRDASLLVTYNGRTFDVPLMEGRWAFHRRDPPTDGLPHFDMLPPARRLWGRPRGQRRAPADWSGYRPGLPGFPDARASAEEESSCRLSALERSVLGFHRIDDVPGFDIPVRYFQFLRTGEAAMVEGVLEHNRHDIVSLAVIMSHALWLAQEGPNACREPAERLALARLYERSGDVGRARETYEMAAETGDAEVRQQALAALALICRRDGRHDDAARLWEEVLDASGQGKGAPALERRAAEALAIHHEHRAKDLQSARRYAETLGRCMARDGRGGLTPDVETRLQRLDRKIERRVGRADSRTGADPLAERQQTMI